MRRLEELSLWIGNAGDLSNPRSILDTGIEAIVELADNEPFANLPRGLIRCRFPLADGGDNPLWLLHLAASSVAALLKAGVPTLICCSCGMNRSLCVAAAGLAIASNRPFDDVIRTLAKSGPADISPALLAQFRAVLVS